MNTPRIRNTKRFDLFVLGLAAFGLILLRGADACEAGARPDEASASATVVAQVGGELIYLSQVESTLAGELQQLSLQRQELLSQGLERLIEGKLLQGEAQRRGLSVAELLEAEVNAKTGTITQDEVDAWYQANRARVGRPQETVEPQIRSFLAGQKSQELRQALVQSLRSTQKVNILLEPARVSIDPVVSATGVAAKGPENAPVTLVEFSDFQCPWCSRIAPTLEEIRATYGDKVRIEFRHFPLDQLHPEARKASEAAFCAQEQDKFWVLHDDHFANQKALGLEEIKERAESLGLDVAALDRCLHSGRGADAVVADVEAGRKAGVSSTPSFFVNGRPVRLAGSAPPFEQLAKIIEDELGRQGSS